MGDLATLDGDWPRAWAGGRMFRVCPVCGASVLDVPEGTVPRLAKRPVELHRDDHNRLRDANLAALKREMATPLFPDGKPPSRA